MILPIQPQSTASEFTPAYYENIESLYHKDLYDEMNEVINNASHECKKEMMQYFLCYLSAKTPRKHVNFYQYLLMVIIPTL
jgi:hypothetical protein